MKKALFFLAALLTFGLAANAQTAWSENFESGSLSEDWVTYSDNLTNYSNYSQFNNSWQVVTLNSGGHCALSVSWTTVYTDCDRWLVTPSLNVPDDSYGLLFEVCGYAANYPEKVKVMVSTTGVEKTDFTEVLDVVMDGNAYSAEWNTAMVPLGAYAGQNVHIAFVNHGDGYYTLLDNLELKSLPTESIAITRVKADHSAPVGTNFNVQVTVRNYARQNMTSFDLTYDVDGEGSQTENVTGINVAPYGYYTKTISLSKNDPTPAHVNVSVSNPNNATDPDLSDNTGSAVCNVYNADKMFGRRTVLEHFTTAQCVNCPSGHERIESAISGKEDRVIWLAHHAGYYTDDMTIPLNSTMCTFYNDGGGTYAPASMLDRDVAYADAEDPGPVFFPNTDVGTRIANAIENPAPVSCDFSSISYDANSRTVTATISGYFINDWYFDSPRLNFWIMEDGIIGYQSGGGNNYEHNHVIRANITETWGDATAITSTNAWNEYSKTYTYTLPAEFNADKCWVAAFVSNYSEDVNDCRIENGVKSRYLTDPTLGLSDAELGASVTTWPNPATEEAYVSAESTIRSYTMVNAMGQIVMAAESVNQEVVRIDVRNLAAGVYFVTVSTDNGTATQRLSVVK